MQCGSVAEAVSCQDKCLPQRLYETIIQTRKALRVQLASHRQLSMPHSSLSLKLIVSAHDIVTYVMHYVGMPHATSSTTAD